MPFLAIGPNTCEFGLASRWSSEKATRTKATGMPLLRALSMAAAVRATISRERTCSASGDLPLAPSS
ncbi:hypothetical protein D3C86_1817740 [compost metagenome]